MIKQAIFIMGLLSCISSISFTQEQFSISKPTLELKGDLLIITYNIVNSKPGENYKVNLSITDSEGNTVEALSLLGDLGLNIEGGKNKRIIWEFTTDEVTEEMEIIVKLMAELQQAESPVLAPENDTYSRSGLILRSIALPGLGMTKLKQKPYWIIGAAAYGLIANGVYFHIKSGNTYNNEYNNDDHTLENEQERQDAYSQYETERTISITSFCGAGAIWLTNLVTIYLASGKIQKSPSSYMYKKFNLYPVYDAKNRYPMLSMTYRF